MQKRAQITIFLVIAIIMIGTLFLLSYSQDTIDAIRPSADTTGIKGFVQSCMSQIGEWAVYDTSLQGGYYTPPEPNFPYFYVAIPYYWNNQAASIPSQGEIEQELAAYLFDNINHTCLNDFNDFRKLGYRIYGARLSDPSEISAVMRDGSVLFTLRHPISFEKGNSKTTLDSFQVSIPLDMKKPYDLSNAVIAEQSRYPNEMPLSSLAALAAANNFTFEITYFGEDDVLYSLIFDVPHKEPLVYGFMARYDWSELRYG
ncbi:hypothetical protein J4435_04430 [Candidatus Woesearchaeota archaeon]|nr:hypothetical protein [Candidatus Woesearchaeota archaeon]